MTFMIHCIVVATVADVKSMYWSLLRHVNDGKTKAQALRIIKKDFTTLRRTEAIYELLVTRRDKFDQVRVSYCPSKEPANIASLC